MKNVSWDIEKGNQILMDPYYATVFQLRSPQCEHLDELLM